MNTKAIDFTKLRAMFDAALKSELKQPLFRFPNGIRINVATPNGKNPGALYVKRNDAYIGKIVGLVFTPAGQVSEATIEALRAVANDPKAAAVQYGRETGNCCMCGRDLTNAISVKLGIGPICGGRVGFFTAEEVDAYENDGDVEVAASEAAALPVEVVAPVAAPVAAPVIAPAPVAEVEVEDGLTKIALSQDEISHLIDLLSLQHGWDDLYKRLNAALK